MLFDVFGIVYADFRFYLSDKIGFVTDFLWLYCASILLQVINLSVANSVIPYNPSKYILTYWKQTEDGIDR